MQAALTGIRVLDLSVNAPGPFATKMMADLGAAVTRIVNPGQAAPAYAGAEGDAVLSGRGGPTDALAAGKAAVPLDLKSAAGRDGFLAMAAEADVVVSEMRPGKLEALGLGWEALHAANPRLILCEISGYGRHGPLAGAAGHDIDYIARAGALSLIRDAAGKPVAPMNFLADYGAGGSMAVTAVLAALIERGRTGQGCALAVSMTGGVRYLIADMAAATLLAGQPSAAWRGTLSGAMPTYDTYATADGEWIAVGALEPKFIAALADGLGWPELPALMARRETWEAARTGLAARFAARGRDDWAAHFAGTDACVAPVLAPEDLAADGLPRLGDAVEIRRPGG
ncbi:CaiB/BaiF CoA-transferase family protein [Paralimibaculum aggregatum]|uniref:CaiB/BaiF CoA-transferase family protein n=1 Tax=Paralimibaculum aggregatum TaxID=3036245 RepID=A0ABQ6LDW2_9RHOB|nr:CaiB/BaiF CoA-transferase family protein [Limibaculum sp. NKW23]GMG81543.1 CaiB/BaiF CoA-transferase family protein [Limibaculum sp. NKW23]